MSESFFEAFFLAVAREQLTLRGWPGSRNPVRSSKPMGLFDQMDARPEAKKRPQDKKDEQNKKVKQTLLPPKQKKDEKFNPMKEQNDEFAGIVHTMPPRWCEDPKLPAKMQELKLKDPKDEPKLKNEQKDAKMKDAKMSSNDPEGDARLKAERRALACRSLRRQLEGTLGLEHLTDVSACVGYRASGANVPCPLRTEHLKVFLSSKNRCWQCSGMADSWPAFVTAKAAEAAAAHEYWGACMRMRVPERWCP